MKTIFAVIVMLLLPVFNIAAQTEKKIPFKLEELTSPGFKEAVSLSGGVCIIPLGIIEKHGPHLPLGTDMFEIREVAFKAASREYAVVFPPYYFGQIFEARHQPGTISYSNDLMWRVLEETCSELSRNGLKKIILANGHGGNNAFLQYFCQSQLSSKRDYIVVFFQPGGETEYSKEISSLKKATLDGHAGEEETSMMYYIRPDLVKTENFQKESGLDQARLENLKNGYTGIWWFAKFPNHFAADVVRADKRLGELLVESDGLQLAGLVKYLKSNNDIEKLTEEFMKLAGSHASK